MEAKIIGKLELIGSTIKNGKHSSNNYIYCDNTYGDVVLENSTISFNGSNSVLYIVGGNKKTIKIKATLNNETAIYIGRNSSFHKTASVHLAASERASIIIGQDCLFSRDIWVRTSDSHPFYSIDTHERLNEAKDVIIGDHIWVGQDSMILKGAIIGSGSIIGARSLLSGKKYYSNSLYAGIPAKAIPGKEGKIFFDKTDINLANEKTLKDFKKLDTNDFIYSYSKENFIGYSIIDFLAENKNPTARIEFFKQLSNDKNRFALSKEQETSEGVYVQSL